LPDASPVFSLEAIFDLEVLFNLVLDSSRLRIEGPRATKIKKIPEIKTNRFLQAPGIPKYGKRQIQTPKDM